MTGSKSEGWAVPIQCLSCQAAFPQSGFHHRCPKCGGLYDFSEPLLYAPVGDTKDRIWRYRQTFPLPADAKIISLGEGDTPLVSCDLFDKEVYFKCDYLNPTGSFKDRGTAVMVSALISQGVGRAVDDSSGNAGASFAAYASRANLKATIFIPEYASGPKRAQMQAYGAEIRSIPGPRSASAEAVLTAVEAGETYASHAHLPHGIAGMATVAFEIVERLGRTPGAVITPVGQGTLLLGLGRGFRAMMNAGLIDDLPQLVAVQAAACAPIWRMYAEGFEGVGEFPEGETIAEGIRIQSPLRKRAILDEIRTSQGRVVAVDEEGIQKGRASLAKLGLYVEPTSAVVWPALHQGIEFYHEPIVAVLTGSGFKSNLGL